MKSLLIALAMLFPSMCSAAVTVRAGTNIANYPNNGSPSTNNRFIMEFVGVTNQNISYLQLKTGITQGLATVSFVNSTTVSATNGLAHTNFVKSQDTIVSNGVISQLLILSNNMPANLWTNSGGFVRLTTNGPVSIASTGLLGGLVVTQDIRFLGHNAASNSVWGCTNATTGEGEWRSTIAELISYNTPEVIAGAGSGSTNYTLQVISPKMLLGSSNVNIVAVMQTIAGKTHNWSVNITNLSADTWGIRFDSSTNRWRFQSYMYGTNAPSVLTNNTLLRLNGESEGTNTLVTYEYFAPGL